MSAAGEYSWVTEWLTQFLKSPLWTTPVQSFIDENCEIFEDGDEEENDLEFTVRHKKFCMLVDELLSRNLADLGVGEEKFLEIVGTSGNKDLDHLVNEYLLSMDDFLTFRKMMEKRNVELELEAMTVLEEIREKNLAVGGINPTSADEEETLKAAIEASVDDKDLVEKQLEMEDAELQHALAISLAQEEERQREREQVIAAEVKDKEEQKKKVEEAKKAHEERVRQMEEANLQARIEVISKAAEVQAVSKVAEAVKAESVPAPAPAPTPTPAAPVHSVEKKPVAVKAAPPAPAPVKAEPEKKPEPVPEPKKEEAPKPAPPVATPAPVPTSDKVQLAPIGGKTGQGHAMPLGRQFAPLPGISLGAKPTFSQLKSAVVENVKQEIPAEKAAPKLEEAKKDEPSKDELARRENYLKAQRDRLIKQKKEARETALDEYIKEKTGQAPSSGDDAKKGKELDNAHVEMRRALAKRVKEDLLGSAGQ